MAEGPRLNGPGLCPNCAHQVPKLLVRSQKNVLTSDLSISLFTSEQNAFLA